MEEDRAKTRPINFRMSSQLFDDLSRFSDQEGFATVSQFMRSILEEKVRELRRKEYGEKTMQSMQAWETYIDATKELATKLEQMQRYDPRLNKIVGEDGVYRDPTDEEEAQIHELAKEVRQIRGRMVKMKDEMVRAGVLGQTRRTHKGDGTVVEEVRGIDGEWRPK